MIDTNQPLLLLLKSGIFPDSTTVEQAVKLIDGYSVQRLELDATAMSTDDWDRVLEKIIKSAIVVVL